MANGILMGIPMNLGITIKNPNTIFILLWIQIHSCNSWLAKFVKVFKTKKYQHSVTLNYYYCKSNQYQQGWY